jgi:hypothetical protein
MLLRVFLSPAIKPGPESQKASTHKERTHEVLAQNLIKSQQKPENLTNRPLQKENTAAVWEGALCTSANSENEELIIPKSKNAK